jgi:hypothetical protein
MSTLSFEQFRLVVDGIRQGHLAVGSRTPVADVPAWATLKVVTGGFATGELLAGGPLLPHEFKLERGFATDVGVPVSRQALNDWCLTEAGLQWLQQLLVCGAWRIDVPEEGALLVVAALVGAGRMEHALTVLRAIVPFFDRLRFYPVPDQPRAAPLATVCRQPLSTTIRELEAIRVPRQVARMNDAITRIAGYEDRVVALFLEVVDDDSRPDTDWFARATALSREVQAAQQLDRSNRRLNDHRRPLPRLFLLLQRCVDGDVDVVNEQRTRLRWTLSLITNKRGAPGSTAHTALRAAQAQQAAQPTHRQLAHVVIERVTPCLGDGCLVDVDGVTQPVGDHAVPHGIVKKLERSLQAPVDVLVERGVIPSAEVLATVAPQLTAQARSAGIADTSLRGVYSAVYQAFRRRRSLLLLNLEHQVRLEELPWIGVLEGDLTSSASTVAMSRSVYEQLASLTLTSFPHTLVPNTLLQEFVALAKGAAIDAPFTEELAADIFMGTFTPKFIAAAQVAARLLGGSVYERAYGLPFDRVLTLGASSTAPFASLCGQLAASPTGLSSRVAASGRVIEQQQLLTTHNLAVLVTTASLSSSSSLPWTTLAQQCFEAVLALRQQTANPRDALVKHKAGAFAWRQLVFFLSLADDDSVEAWRAGVSSTMAAQPALRPYWRGLQKAIDGHVASLDERYLGWV